MHHTPNKFIFKKLTLHKHKAMSIVQTLSLDRNSLDIIFVVKLR